MDDKSLFPMGLTQTLEAIAWLVTYAARADADPAVMALMGASLVSNAVDAQTKVERRRSLRGARDTIRRARQDADVKSDREFKRLQAEEKYRQGDDRRIRAMLGCPVSDVLGLPPGEQVASLDAFYARASGTTDVELPAERLAAAKSAHEEMKAQVLAEAEIEAEHQHAATEEGSALKLFRNGYSLFVWSMVFHLGEEQAWRVLPRVDRARSGADEG